MSENNEQLHPKHYCSHPSKIECIEVAQYHNFNIGSIIKYVWRLGLKDGTDSIDDLHKIINYANFEIQRLKQENIPADNDGEIFPFYRYYIANNCAVDLVMPVSIDSINNSNLDIIKYTGIESFRVVITRSSFLERYHLAGEDEIANLRHKGWTI